MLDKNYEVVVIGGSWAGLAAAMQLGRARRGVLVVDAGQPRNRYARSSHGFLGQDGRPPAAILDTFRAQVLAYPTVRFQAAMAEDACSSGDAAFIVQLSSGESVAADRLILATGVVDELPGIPGLAERWGSSVLHCPYCHGYEVADARLGVLAMSEMALHKALLLPDWSRDVTLFTNGKLVPDSAQLAALEARGIRLETRPLDRLVGEAPGIAGARLQDGALVELDALFVTSRTGLASPLAERLGCELEEGPTGPIVRTDTRKETSVPGVFCAGDAARTPHSATWAAADGATAGISAHQSIALAAAGVTMPSR